MNKLKKIENFLNDLLEKKASLLSWIMAFLSIIFIRIFIEQFLALAKPILPYEVVIEYVQSFYFFSLTIILIWLILSLILKIKPQKLSFIFISSLLLVPLPPLIDIIKTGGEAYWSFYLFSSPSELWLQYRTVFGHLPSAIVYFGTKITFLGVILLLTFLIWLRTKSYLKTIGGAIIIYSMLFFMGGFPSFFYYGYNLIFPKKSFFEIKSFEIFEFFGSPNKILGVDFQNFKYAVAYRLDFIYFILLIALLALLFWRIDRQKFIAVWKNARFPQLAYHSGLFFVGMAIGALNYPQNSRFDLFSILVVLVVLISIWLAWLASVVVNDLNDFAIDSVSNPERPLQKRIFMRDEYTHLAWLFFLLSVIGTLSVGFSFMVLIIVYQIIAWAYSAPPFRLKKFPIVGTFVSSVALLMILFLGYILMSDNQTIYSLSLRIIFLMLISGTICLPIKDFKDITGDARDNVWTLPVIFGEKKARLIVAMNLFISFMLSVFLLNELRLFWWALIFGTIAFLIVVSDKIKPRQLFWPVLFDIFIYGLVMVRVLFF
ncbi:MAG: UbiA family prenyltransferase [Parcubacteria group bacterium]|jgi:chlorophyll synthase